MENYPNDAYGEEEEEWDREGLLDPAWEKQQKKVMLRPFTTFPYLVSSWLPTFLKTQK
jgi:hypothetical protein